MSDRKHTRLMVSFAIAGLFMAYFAQCGPAHADPMMLPEGTTIVPPPDGHKNYKPQAKTVTLDATHYLLTRPMLDRANAAAETSRRLTGQLMDCTRRVVRVTKPEPGWRIAGRWAIIGGAVTGAFIGGLML